MNSIENNTNTIQRCLFEKESKRSLYSVFHVLFNNIDYVKDDKIKVLRRARKTDR